MERIILEKFPDEVRHVWSRVGTAEVATDPMGIELTDMYVTLHPRHRWTRAGSQAELVTLIARELRGIPGQKLAFSQPIELRMNEMISGVRSDLGIKLFGDDFKVLTETGRTEHLTEEGMLGSVHAFLDEIFDGRDMLLRSILNVLHEGLGQQPRPFDDDARILRASGTRTHQPAEFRQPGVAGRERLAQDAVGRCVRLRVLPCPHLARRADTRRSRTSS